MVNFTKYTLAELEAMPTISKGHMDDLKAEIENIRIWLSRMTVEDGMPYNNMATVEFYNPKNYAWETIAEYQAK